MVVQITTFRLASGATEQAFLDADRRVQNELIANQPGFVRRTTARRQGEWLVVTLWWSEENAAAFAALAAGHPVQAAFDAHLEPGSQRSSRFDTLD